MFVDPHYGGPPGSRFARRMRIRIQEVKKTEKTVPKTIQAGRFEEEIFFGYCVQIFVIGKMYWKSWLNFYFNCCIIKS